MQLSEADTESISLLCTLTNVDADTAQRVYQKHNGDMNKAAEAIFGGDKGEETWTQRHNTPEPSNYYDPNAVPAVRAPNDSTIDLTGESDSGPTFGPSNRAPDPNWAVVPSNIEVPGAGISHDDQTLNEAIQASLNDVASGEETFPTQDLVRDGGRPVALRPQSPSLACPAIVVQALYFVPQVRAAVGQLRLPEIQPDVPFNHPARAIWNLIELYATMDLGQLAAIVDVEVLPSLEDEERHGDGPPDRAAAVVNSLGRIIEAHLSAQQDDDEEDSIVHLFEFSSVMVELSNRLPRKVSRNHKGSVVALEVPPNGGGDLVSRLTSLLSRFDEGKSTHDVIVEPSEMISFKLVRHPPPDDGQKKPEAIPFQFPKSFFLDQFLFRNLEISVRKQTQQLDLSREIEELKQQRETLTHLNQRDTLRDLKTTIHYYEHIAQSGGDPERQQVLTYTLERLNDILVVVESKVAGINQKIQELEKISDNLFDVPELQQLQYDLRAVLVHTGLPGRKQLYSYIQDADGVWWKTCDYEVTEVPEEIVFNDTAGLHLSAGPFLLLYSKHLSDEELHLPVNWPSIFTEQSELNNERLLQLVPPEQAAKATPRRQPAPPPSPLPPPTPSRSERHFTPPPRTTSMGPRPNPVSHHRGTSRTLDIALQDIHETPRSSY
ncbi:hypothetical protein FA15DRAFT_664043 [Coprinopsis marcescibilis]|uniref:USP domain-containing protein n=1 Tax=Coprinopsis marcescibilis TaxID=230819 RepID=A0A5C3L9Q8_COPMA|nr:hypothetical protein FA15DRAFT_664043 [Coprinopsis marcescibilis]